MSSAFKIPRLRRNGAANGVRGLAFWLQVALAVLLLLNLAALYFYFSPPGGSRAQLTDEEAQVRQEIRLHRMSASRLRTIASKVEKGGDEGGAFARQYFLPRRTAFGTLVTELLRMSTAAGLSERERTYSEDPIEGTDDLTLLTVNANYQGTYANLVQFLNQVDHSRLLLILDTLNATPQQPGSQTLNVTLRFLAVIREDGSVAPTSAAARGPQ